MFREFYLFKNYSSSKRLLRHIVFWLSTGGLYYLTYLRFDPGNAWILVSKELFAVMTIFYTMSYVIIPRFLQKLKLIYLLFWLVISYFWWALCTYLMCYLLKGYGAPSERLTIYINLVLDNGLLAIVNWNKLPFYVLDFIYFTSLPLGLKVMQILFNEKIKSARLERDNLELEIDFLKSQINPHFLFNTLNNIYSMIQIGDRHAGHTVLQLSSLMKYTLYQSNEPEVPLDKELNFIQSYLELGSVRYEEKIKLNFEIDILDNELGIVPLILFPFIENAFKHGPDKSSVNCWIDISIKLNGNILNLKVSNSTIIKNTENIKLGEGGVGIANALKRLELNYKNNYHLSRESKGDSYDVILSITLNEYRNLASYIKSQRQW